MAIQWMDDFTCYGTDSSRVGRMTNGNYTEAAGGSAGGDLVADPDPTSTGAYVFGQVGNANSILRKTLSSAQTTVGVCYRLWMSALPSTSNNSHVLASFRDQNNVQHGYLTLDASGFLKYYRSDNGSDVLIGSSTAPVVAANGWAHFETKLVLDATVGSIEVRKEGFTALIATGVRTTTNVAGAIASCFNVAMKNTDFLGPNQYFKDFIIWDGSGTANNNFMSTCQVYKILPQSDASLNWNTSSGTTGYNLINETTPDDDTSYVSAPFPLPSPSTFNLTDLPSAVSSVRGVMVMHRSRKTDGGDGNVKVSVISGGNTGVGTDRPITTAYSYWTDIFDKDPSGTIWSRTLVNALQLKLDRTL